jgi:2-dehydropantoate 2-reductase
MRYIIYGAGAIGGTIGARLHLAGEDVVLIARGAHLDAICERGLTFETPDESHTLRIPAVGHPREIDWREDDVVFLTMKTQDTEAALGELAGAAGTGVPVICAQNGVENERLALRRFPDTYAMVVMLPASHLEPGKVQAESSPVTGILDAGRYPGGTDGRIAEVCAVLERARFSARLDPKVLRQKYAKLLMNLGNAVAACCGIEARGGDLMSRTRAEALACYEAAGIDSMTVEEFAERRGDLIQVKPVAGRERDGGSSWQSLQRGTGSIEADYLNGEICLLGRLHGVPTPVNRALQDAANRMAREGRQPGSMSVEELLGRADG